MTIIGKGISRGVAAGAEGTTALNAVSGLDALLRGGPLLGAGHRRAAGPDRNLRPPPVERRRLGR